LDFVEGHTGGRAIASTRWTRRGRRPWRVWTLFVQEPGELGCGRRGIAGPCREGEEPKPVMNASKQSDPAIVAMKPTNKAGSVTAAESVEPRVGTEGNVDQQSTHRTQTRARVSQALGRVRQAAKASKASPTLRRQTPEVGAECPNRARSVLCGGRAVMCVPTAIGRERVNHPPVSSVAPAAESGAVSPGEQGRRSVHRESCRP